MCPLWLHCPTCLALSDSRTMRADTAAVVWDKDRLLLRRESQTGM